MGKNEAGKSAIFHGLSKLKPSDGKKHDGLKEFPRRHFTDEFDKCDWPVASCRYVLSKSDSKALSAINISQRGQESHSYSLLFVETNCGL